MTLIHPISYKSQSFIDEILPSLVDKYQITYQNIWGEDMVRPHLVKLDHYKILKPLKGTSSLNHFSHTRNVFNSSCYTKKNLEKTETYNYF